jgi:hypothetical protein
MLKLSNAQHQSLVFWGLALIALGLPLSVFLVSIGTFVLAGNWLLEKRYATRLKQFFKDPVSVVLSAVFVIHVIGLFYTENLGQGLKELRIKLPLLLLPLFLFTSKLPGRKRIKDVLMLFVLACVISTGLGMLRYLGFTGEDIINKRWLSVFISHIRFGLMLDLSVFILIYYLATNWRSWSIFQIGLTVVLIFWLFFFIVLLEGATAYLAFGLMFGLSIVLLILRSKSAKIKLLSGIALMVVGTASMLYINQIYKNQRSEIPFDYRTLTVKTANGRYYSHQTDVPYRENGHRVWNFVCMEEIENEWPKVSQRPIDSLDQRGQAIRFTAIRYLTSKGLLKDSAGIHRLSSVDIENIEKGYTNHKYVGKWGVSRRIAQAFWELEEYQHRQNANYSSLFQRWVYTKVGLSIFKERPVFGIGTGDMLDEYRNAYEKNDHGLIPKLQGISHNQPLTIAIELGIVGFIIFLISLFYPLWLYHQDYLYVMFFTLIMVSFMTDNTLGSQSGVTLYAFFNAFLIVRREVYATNSRK